MLIKHFTFRFSHLFLFLYLFIFSSAFALKNSSQEEKIAIFFPPKGWKYAPPLSSSEYILAAFVSDAHIAFRPSINIAQEHTELSLENYANIVMQNHKNDPFSTCQDFGFIQTKAGKAKILEISSKTRFGEIKLLQFICHIPSNNTVYIMTGAAPKKNFSSLYSLFIDTFRTFTIENNLFSAIGNKTQRDMLIKEYDYLINSSSSIEDIHNKHWKNFEKHIIKNYADLGSYWQFLLLKKASTDLIKKIDCTP